MKNKLLSFFWIFMFCNLFSQDDKILLSVSESEISVYDFLKNYYKNKLETDTLSFEDSLQEYLDLYVNFKLKVVEAERLGLDTLPTFIRELEGYRRQLVKPYLTDRIASEELLDEAYDRLKSEVSASHILIKTNFEEEDTLRAYNKILKIKTKLDQGDDFIKLAKQFSEDPSVKENDGDLGYFSALQMVYPFESAAYETPVGSISNIVKSRYGYHVLKVNDKRLSRGEVKVAHILLMGDKKSGSDPIEIKEKIYEIYDSLLIGTSFEIMAEKYSDDKKSALQGGELGWFGTNKMVKSFEEMAFSLDTIGSLSQPFETELGWHIVKLLDKKSLPPFSDLKESLKKRVERDSRSQKTRNIVVNRLKNEWDFYENPAAKKIFYNIIDEDFLNGVDVSKKIDGKGHVMFLFNEMYDISERYIYQKDFLDYLTNFRSRLNVKTNFKTIVDQFYNTFKEQKILELESNNLEEKHDSFRLLYSEYHDGILMYQLQKDEVWDKAIKDTLGLSDYYMKNQVNYIWPNRLDVKMYHCNDSRTLNKVNRKLKWGKIDDASLLKEINKTSTLNLHIQDSIFSFGDNPIIDSFVFSLDWHLLKKDDIILTDNNIILYISEVLPSRFKLLSEIKGIVISDYQSFLEQEWLRKLREKHTVFIDEKVLEALKKREIILSGDEIKELKDGEYIESYPLYYGGTKQYIRHNQSDKKTYSEPSEFSDIFDITVKKLGSSVDTFFGWRGNIYNTQMK